MTEGKAQNALRWAQQTSALSGMPFTAACMHPPVFQTAAPGQTDANPATAAQIFNDVCWQSGTPFSSAPAAVSGYPLTHSAQTGTYVHNTQNLSVKRIGNPTNPCSMVFMAGANPAENLAQFMVVLNQLAPGDDGVGLGDRWGPDGKTYLS